METLTFFLKGLGAGFVVAAPVGPVAVLCVRRTLARGAMAGYATGLGAAVADTCYGLVAAFGIQAIAGLLTDNAFWFRLLGGAVLVVLATRTLLTTGPAEGAAKGAGGPIRDFLSALMVTGTNPVTVVAFGGVFASVGAFVTGQAFDWAEALVAGVFVGSALWWATLTAISSVFRRTVSHAGLTWINRVSGGVILLCGILVLVSAAFPDPPAARIIEQSVK